MLLVVGLGGAWFARDLWWERAFGRPARPEPGWKSPAPDSVLIRRVARSSGDAFIALGAEDLATLLEGGAGAALTDPRAAIVGDQVRLRGRLRVRDLPSLERAGPLADLLTGEPEIEVAGRPALMEKGIGGIQVTDLRVGGVQVPRNLRDALVTRLAGLPGVTSAAPGGIRFSVPPWVGDVRVTNGKLTVYRDRR